MQPVNAGGALSLGVANGGSTANGTQFQQLSSGASYERMNIVPIGNGNYKITMASATNKCVDMPTGGGNGTRLQMYDCWGGTNQQWQITPGSLYGTYTIKNASNGLCIDEPAGATSSGMQMQVYSCTAGNKNQMFYIKTGS